MGKLTEEVREAYKSLQVPALFLLTHKGQFSEVIATEGFLTYFHVERDLFEKTFQERVDGRMYMMVHPDEAEKLRKISQDFLQKGIPYDVVFRARREDGYHMLHAVGYWQKLDEEWNLAQIVYSDMKDHEDTLSQLTRDYSLFQKDGFYTDALTDLTNINFLHKNGDKCLEEIRLSEKQPAVLYFDVDSMSSYNNQYGFKQGDSLLQLVARLLQKRFEYDLVARGADDHFIVVTRWTDKQQLTDKILMLNDEIKKNAFGNTTGIHVGVYACEEADGFAEAMERARQANKSMGADLSTPCRFYSEENDREYQNQRYIVENFYKAINSHWIKVYYQCFERLETGNGYGFEALARWEDPEKGLITPGQFIPAIEKYHLMHELDLYMFEQVCKELKLRYDAGLPLLPVSVNFSRQDFDYVDVVGELNRLVEEYRIEQYGIDRSYFIIEITEQDMAMATDVFLAQLGQIKKSGFKLWIDDFGSGYSSLNVFSRFDVDLIKFDMELLRDLDLHNGANREILKAMIDVAKRLGIHTLCEGMETEYQKDFLLKAGCELAQGYLYHEPEGLDTIFERLHIGIPIPSWETSEERIERENKWEQDFSEKME